MRHFQDLGHTVVFLIGDMTGLIGDPTGRNVTRPPMTRDDIARNAETYKSQVFKILDPAKTEIRFNSEWFDTMRFEDVIRLAGRYTVARLMERDDFSKRFKEQAPISVHELLYPLLKGTIRSRCRPMSSWEGPIRSSIYWWAANCSATTVFLRRSLRPFRFWRDCMSIPERCRSLREIISVSPEPPADMFRKLMNISDALIWRYYELLTDLSMEEIGAIRAAQKPLDAKKQLAKRIVADFHSIGEAETVASAWGGLPPLETLDRFEVNDARLNRALTRVLFLPSRRRIRSSNQAACRYLRFPRGLRRPLAVQLTNLRAGDYIVRVGKKYKHLFVQLNAPQ